MSTKTRPEPTPGEVLRQEAREHAGHGRSAIAIENRRRRIFQLTLRRCSAKEISERTGWPLRTVERDLPTLHRDALLQVSTADLQKDAAEQLEEFAAQRARILDALACIGPEHRNHPRLLLAWIELTKVRHVFLERAGLRKPLDQGGPPDASDLRGMPTHAIEAEMARIASQLYERLDPRGYLRAVEEMQQGDVIDVPAFPAASTEDGDPSGGDEAAWDAPARGESRVSRGAMGVMGGMVPAAARSHVSAYRVCTLARWSQDHHPHHPHHPR